MSYAVTFLTLAILGAINAVYLASHRVRRKTLVCPLDHDCNVVTDSRWSKILGIRNEYLGVVFFVALSLAALILLVNPEWAASIDLSRWILYAAVGGFFYSLFLVYLQAFVIKDYCFYCIISAIITTLLFINSFALV